MLTVSIFGFRRPDKAAETIGAPFIEDAKPSNSIFTDFIASSPTWPTKLPRNSANLM